MAPTFGNMLRSVWHSITTNDRHASLDAPYRTGQHVSMPPNRHTPLTSVATTAMDSRVDLNSSLQDPDAAAPSPMTPYSPGARTVFSRTQSADVHGLSRQSTGEIQMQNFSDGLPPPPPAGHSWKRIDRWAEENYGELYDNISPGCTQNDINELEHELDCTLPMEVRQSLQIHDGQERGGIPTGIIFGCMLLDCEEIVQEWKNWRRVSEDYLLQSPSIQSPQVPLKAFSGPESSSQPTAPPEQTPTTSWQDALQARQDSQPPNATLKAYAHRAWIPLARDWGGNCLAVDLAPGPTGKWGQIILMGRDYDCKYVVARSWAALLATVADDICSNKVFVHEETGELKLREFKQPGVEPPYLDILRWRTDQKYGRRPRHHRVIPNGELKLRPTQRTGSPRGSLAGPNGERSPSPQHLEPRRGSAASPMRKNTSPLAKVNEEMPPAIKVHTNSSRTSNSAPKIEKLISMGSVDNLSSQRNSVDNFGSTTSSANGSNKENVRISGDTLKGKGVAMNRKSGDEDEMTTVEI